MLSVLTGVIAVILATICIAVYQKCTNAVCRTKKRLDGKVTIVTGGPTGMGFEVAKDFAARGAKVIIASPYKEEGFATVGKIKKHANNDQVTFKLLDLASLKSVRQFADDILNTEDRLDILVNNAGVSLPGNFLTVDGINFIMQVNYYGHFLLTILLMPLLKKSGTPVEKSRIVNVSSLFHLFASTNLSQIHGTNYWCTFRIYCNSKLCLILFAHELTKNLNGTNVVVNSVDPGAVGTRLFDGINLFLGSIITFLAGNVYKTPKEGAQATIHVAVDEKAGTVSGQFFKNCKLIRPRQAAYNNKLSKMLWENSICIVKLSENEIDVI